MMHHVTQSEEKELQYNLQIGKIIILVLTGIKFDTDTRVPQLYKMKLKSTELEYSYTTGYQLKRGIHQ
jgi:hypothetical protein